MLNTDQKDALLALNSIKRMILRSKVHHHQINLERDVLQNFDSDGHAAMIAHGPTRVTLVIHISAKEESNGNGNT
jgi:hypothetical protein